MGVPVPLGGAGSPFPSEHRQPGCPVPSGMLPPFVAWQRGFPWEELVPSSPRGADSRGTASPRGAALSVPRSRGGLRGRAGAELPHRARPSQPTRDEVIGEAAEIEARRRRRQRRCSPGRGSPRRARRAMTERCSLWSALSAAACCFYRGSFMQVQVSGGGRDRTGCPGLKSPRGAAGQPHAWGKRRGQWEGKRAGTPGHAPAGGCFDPRVQRGGAAEPPRGALRCPRSHGACARSARRQRARGEPSTGSGGRARPPCSRDRAVKATTSPQTSALTGRKVSAGSSHLQQTS